MLDLVCHDVEVERVLQEITGESLARGANTAPDARLDIHARGFWSRQGSTFSLTYGCATQMRNRTRTSPLSKYIASMKREETYVRKPSYGGGTSHVHAADIHHYWWHGT